LIGPEDIADAHVTLLSDEMPDKVAELASELAVPAGDIPAPALITAQERDLLNLTEWPALFVVVQRLDGLRRVDGPNEDGTVTYLSRYPVRIFGFVRGHGYEVVDLLRKRYVRAVREVLFAGQEAIELVESTYTESYSDVDEDASKRSVAGFYADFVAEVAENLAGRPHAADAPADGWDIDVDLDVLPHPALD
jgi:hypothetical protein